ncbi:hypothetical protein D3C72_2309530 [compost metagenome]
MFGAWLLTQQVRQRLSGAVLLLGECVELLLRRFQLLAARELAVLFFLEGLLTLLLLAGLFAL